MGDVQNEKLFVGDLLLSTGSAGESFAEIVRPLFEGVKSTRQMPVPLNSVENDDEDAQLPPVSLMSRPAPLSICK